jgi:hypothetical protein
MNQAGATASDAVAPVKKFFGRKLLKILHSKNISGKMNSVFVAVLA